MASQVTVEAFGKKVRTSSTRRFVAVGVNEAGELKVLGRGDTGVQAQGAAKKAAPSVTEIEVLDLGEKRRTSTSEKKAEGTRKKVAAVKEKSGQSEAAAADAKIDEAKASVVSNGSKSTRTKIQTTAEFVSHLEGMKHLAEEIEAKGGKGKGVEALAYELRKRASTAYYFGDRLLKAARS